VGKIPLQDIINQLREAAGQNQIENNFIPMDNLNIKPDWYAAEAITATLDAREMLQAGAHPLADVLSKTSKMQSGEIFELITPFVPMPLIEKVTQTGLKAYVSEDEGGVVHSYFFKP
jgi:uncharacterized protein (DUF2249 family)